MDQLKIDALDKRVKEAFRKNNEEWLKLATQTAKIGLWDWDISSNQVVWTQPLYEIHGVSPGEFDATVEGFNTLIHPEDRDLVSHALQRTLENKAPYELEFRSVRPDGQIIWMFTSATVLRDEHDKPLRLLGMSMDVTQRKTAELALRESEERFRAMADTAVVLIWVADTTKRRVYFNKPWLDFTGRTLAQELDEGWKENIHPDDKQRYWDMYSAAFDARTTFELEYRLRRLDGQYRWLLVRGAPRFTSESKFSGYVGSCLDITERKVAEDALKKAGRRKDEFLATLAHELRNPLAPLRNGLHIMQLAQDDKETLRQTRDMMERQLNHLLHLVDDLLDVSRISRGKIELRRGRVELATILHSAIETSGPLVEQSGHQLIVEIPPEPVFLDADVTRLAQVFSNMLNNASKYTETGGTIRLSVKLENKGVLVSIKDTGIGIPEPLLSSIFEMFTQATRSLEKSQGGLGVGLSIAKRLVEMHGGVVKVCSEGVGKGSEFSVWLPTLATSAKSQMPPVPQPFEGVKPRRILVADDNEDCVSSMAMLLRMFGHEVAVAHDGLEAVEVASQFSPDLIFMDIGMPKLNGYEACQRIRKEAWGASIVVVALTGWGQEKDKQKTRQAGFNHHLVKPVESKVLMELLTTLTPNNLDGQGDRPRAATRSLEK